MFKSSLFVVTALATAIAQANDAPTIEEVVSVASLQPIAIEQSGSAITVIDQDYLESRKALQVIDLLRDVPGLAVSATGVRGSQTDVRLRGAESNHVLVLFDGIEINDASQGDALNWAHLAAADIARIEIIRGPQSALWGSEAVAGVISITSKKAGSEKLQTSFFSEKGSFDTFYSGASIAARGEQFHGRLSVDRISADGDNIARQGNEKDGYRNSNIHLTGGYSLSENAELGLVLRRTEASNEFDEVDSIVTGLPADANRETDTRQSFARLQADIDALEGNWTQRIALSQSKHHNTNYSDGVQGNVNEIRKRQIQWLNTLNWAESSQQLSLLLERESQDFSARGPLVWGLDPNQDRTLHTNSAALEYRINATEKLTLAGSLRYDDNSDFDSATTRRAEASYRVAEGTRLRASYGTAVKNPTLSERFGTFSNFIGNPDLQPESVESWQVGVDHTLAGVNFGIGYFNSRLDNEINGFVWNGSGYTAMNTNGVSRREGVELTFDTQLTADLSLQGSYTYTDATQPYVVPTEEIEVRRPRHLGSVSLDWRYSDQLQLLLNAQYNGTSYDQFFPPWPQSSELVTLDDYTLVNLTANYDWSPQVQLYARMDNLLNEQYEDVYGFQTLGRGASIGVRIRFDG